MSQDVKTQTQPTSAHAPPAADIATVFAAGIGLRVDPAQHLPTDPPHAPTLIAAAKSAGPLTAQPAQTGPPELDRGWSHEQQVLTEASTVVAQLRSRMDELNRREQSLTSQLSQLDQERRNLRLWAQQLEHGIQERETQLKTQDAELAQELQACEQLRHDMVRREQKLQSEQETFAHKRARLKEDLDHELCTDREQHRKSLETFQQEQVTFEKRVRFQTDHLQKLRAEVDKAQQEFRIETQHVQQRLEHDESLRRLRFTQLDHVRELLEERERSIEREAAMLAEARKNCEESLEVQQARLADERESWDYERKTQQSELQRQRDMLALHAENLDGRRTRLDRLRVELEETHRNTLELRMAIEEAWAQFSQAAGDEVAHRRVDAARAAITQHYRSLHQSLIDQRRQLEQDQELFRRQKEELHSARENLNDAVTEREEWLRLREEDLRKKVTAFQHQEISWRSARDGWMKEKIEAETIIRDLLRELTEVGEQGPAS